MKTHIVTILAALALGTAYAGQNGHSGNNGNGNGGCGAGQHTNGCGGSGGSSGSGGTVNNGGNGGTGGQGGAGGAGGVGIGIGLAGATASSRADASAKASASARQSQRQGQAQGQQQGQAIVGSGNSRNTNTARGGSANQGQGQSQTNAGNALAGGNNSTSIAWQPQERNPVGSAFAAPLATSNGTCMGSTSAGAQGITVGLSVGTTWTDSACSARYDAEALRAAGEPKAAVARLCLTPEIAQAMTNAGTPCPQARPKHQAVAANEPTDPYIRRRLGLPELTQQ